MANIIPTFHARIQDYGLLGASGCGKSTLLSCVVGVRRLDSGNIWVLGGKPGSKGSGIPGPRAGYMPQDISLVKEFTTENAIYYFGRISGVDDDVIEERLNFLTDLLQLPPRDRQVKNMSGGQQRRVSFAAAMVHKPELLILDEPTVGLDPVLRSNIWSYLTKITREEGTAVVITTHYIEEAKQATDTIFIIYLVTYDIQDSRRLELMWLHCSAFEVEYSARIKSRSRQIGFCSTIESI